MLRPKSLRGIFPSAAQRQWLSVHNSRFYSSRYGGGKDEADLDTARKWFAEFNENTIPPSISRTEFSNSSGPGGQKTNKTSSKATTVWPIDSVKNYVPKILHSELRSSRYYVLSSDSFTIQCDVHRSQTQNREEARRRFNEEVRSIYRAKVPGVTSPEQQAKVQQLDRVERKKIARGEKEPAASKKMNPRATRNSQKADNAARLRMKKMHSAKKSSRKGGGRGDF